MLSNQSTSSVNNEFINSYIEPTIISRRELFDENNYNKIISNNMIDKLTLKKLTQYFKDRKQAGMKEVVYNTGKNNTIKSKDGNIINIGRLYPINGISGMRRDIRNPMTERFYWDLDFVNAHYHLALYLCEKVYNIPCNNMKEYVENRDVWLNKTHPDRKISKQQFLMVAFGGSVKNYDEEFEILDIEFEKNEEVNNFLKVLKQEFNGLAMAIWADPKYEQWKKLKSGEHNLPLQQQPNMTFKLLSKVLQNMEREHLLFLSAYLEMKGRYMGVYIHDGGLIEKLQGEDKFDDNLRIECENAVNIKFNTNMKLMIKPIEYNLTDFTSITSLDNEVLNLSKIDGYDAIKSEFEKTNFWCNDITAGCEVDEKDEYYDLIIRPKQKLFDRHATITYNEYKIEDGNIKVTTKDFIQKWFKDENKRTYKKIDFLPNQEEDKNIFNTFKGLKGDALVSKYPDITIDYIQQLNNGEIDNEDSKHLNMLKEHIQDLSGNDEKMYFYLVQWLAFIVQKRIQPQTALVFQSKQGVGKDLFWGFIYDFIIGKNMVSLPSDINDVIGRFNGSTIENKLMIHINEVSGKDTFAGNDKIKQLIAGQKEISIEKKQENPRKTTNNLAFIFLSNNENPVRVEETDRRWCIFECSNKWVEKNTEERFKHFKELGNIMSNNIQYAERLAVIFYLILKQFDLNEFNILDIPKSKMYNEMKKSQLPIIYYWFKDVCEHMETSNINTLRLKGNELYNKFTEWKNFAGYSKYEMTLTKFGTKIKDYEFITKKRTEKGIEYFIELNKLIEFLKSKDIYEEIFTDND